MAAAVLAVIRAAHPELKNKHDKLAFAIHAIFLTSGYRLVGTGAAEADPEEGPPKTSKPGDDVSRPEDDVSIEGWNSLGDSYLLRYAKDGDERARPVVLSMLAVGSKLLVDATWVGGGGEAVHTLELNVDDYVTDEEGHNYAALYKDLDRLVGRVQGSILSKLDTEEAKDKGVSSGRTAEGPRTFTPHPGASPLAEGPRGGGPRGTVPGIPVGGIYTDPDLMPMGGAGIPPQYGFPAAGRGGMLVGPDDPFFVGAGIRGWPHAPPGGLPEGVPPGARFDPYGPPIPGFEPGRFGEGTGGGRIHPDLEQPPP